MLDLAKIDTVFFDLDGTLIDTSPGVFDAFNLMSDIHGLRRLTREELLSVIGPPVDRSYMRLYGLSRDRAVALSRDFDTRYVGELLHHVVVYDGMFSLLENLKSRGINRAVATYKLEEAAIDLLGHVGLLPYFNSLRGAAADGSLTKKQLIHFCLEEMKTGADRAILIGDSIYDAQAAAEAGLGFVAVTYGFGFKSEADLYEYPYLAVADSVEELSALLGF